MSICQYRIPRAFLKSFKCLCKKALGNEKCEWFPNENEMIPLKEFSITTFRTTCRHDIGWLHIKDNYKVA